MITQRNTIIEFLQEQIHDLILEVNDAHAQINELQQQPTSPVIPAPEAKKKIQRKLREFQTSILSMEILFLVPIIPLQAVSHPWATSMTFSFVELMTS
jgi:hypothetical protein